MATFQIEGPLKVPKANSGKARLNKKTQIELVPILPPDLVKVSLVFASQQEIKRSFFYVKVGIV